MIHEGVAIHGDSFATIQLIKTALSLLFKPAHRRLAKFHLSQRFAHNVRNIIIEARSHFSNHKGIQGGW